MTANLTTSLDPKDAHLAYRLACIELETARQECDRAISENDSVKAFIADIRYEAALSLTSALELGQDANDYRG